MLVFENLKTVTTGNNTRNSRVAVDNGKIIAWDDDCPLNCPNIDCKNLLLFPGIIDPHTHFDEPGYTYREDFSHGSLGAIAGGVTTVFDMPCTSIPPVTDIDSFYNKKRAVTPNAWCDFRLWGGVSAISIQKPSWKKDMEELLNIAGVIGFKTYVLS